MVAEVQTNDVDTVDFLGIRSRAFRTASITGGTNASDLCCNCLKMPWESGKVVEGKLTEQPKLRRGVLGGSMLPREVPSTDTTSFLCHRSLLLKIHLPVRFET